MGVLKIIGIVLIILFVLALIGGFLIMVLIEYEKTDPNTMCQNECMVSDSRYNMMCWNQCMDKYDPKYDG